MKWLILGLTLIANLAWGYCLPTQVNPNTGLIHVVNNTRYYVACELIVNGGYQVYYEFPSCAVSPGFYSIQACDCWS